MATEPLPVIAEDDYEAFREIIPELPDNYADWLKLHEVEKSERSKINPVQEVPVRPDEFVAYCDYIGAKPSEEALLSFAHYHAGPHEASHKYDTTP